MSARSLQYKIGQMYYFLLFGVGRVCEIAAGVMWVMFGGYRVAFDGEGRHLEIRFV